MRVGVVDLGFERLMIIVAHPLVGVEGNNLNCGVLIVILGGLGALIVQDRLDLSEGECSSAVGTSSWITCLKWEFPKIKARTAMDSREGWYYD